METPMTFENPVAQEPVSNPTGPKSQPIDALANLDSPLDDASVRKAIMDAEANNLDPQTVTMQDLAQGVVAKPTEVPQKFLKPDGTVDVDKIQTSTQALDAAIQKKEEAVTKTVDDYMREYNDRENRFRNMPNPERLAANIPPPSVPSAPVTELQPEEIVRRDWINDPLMTTTRLIDMALQARFRPIEQREKAEAVRSNLQAIAAKDSRVLREDVFSAIKAKLASDPDLWNLKNPHKAAWLEVKEEMRLGEPTSVQAQPSRPFSPVLGGGTPPSVPSASVPSPQNVLSNLGSLDLRNKEHERLGDEAIRRALMGDRG